MASNGKEQKTAAQKLFGHGHWLVSNAEEKNPEEAVAMVLLMDQTWFGAGNSTTLRNSALAVRALAEIKKEAVARLEREMELDKADPKKVKANRPKLAKAKADLEEATEAFSALTSVASKLEVPPLLMQQLENGKFVLERPRDTAQRLWGVFFWKASSMADFAYIKATAPFIGPPLVEAGIMSEESWVEQFTAFLEKTFEIDMGEEEAEPEEGAES